jgi:hypothetical protein
MRRLTRRAFLRRAALAGAVAAAGCSASGRSHPALPPEILVERPDDLVDSLWSIHLRGFPPASRVEVTATSFDLAQIAYRRLQGNRHPYPFAHLSYEGAGHGITFPYTPTTSTSYVHPVDGRTYSLGGDPAMTAYASADSWPKVLAFLRDAWIKPR